MNPNQLPTDEPIIENVNEEDNISGEDSDVKPSRRSGRRKIKIEYIEDKNRRHITFSKRKAGIMKKVRIQYILFFFIFCENFFVCVKIYRFYTNR
jgi:hypothetical protein